MTAVAVDVAGGGAYIVSVGVSASVVPRAPGAAAGHRGSTVCALAGARALPVTAASVSASSAMGMRTARPLPGLIIMRPA